MLAHHSSVSSRDTNRGASGTSAAGPSVPSFATPHDPTRPSSGGRSSPLKFFASSSRSQQRAQSIPVTGLAQNKAEGQQQHPEAPPSQIQAPEPEQAGTPRKRWTMDYLADLRKPIGARPMGARPPPARLSTTSLDLPPRAASALEGRTVPESPTKIERLKRSISPFGGQRSSSALSHRRDAGRPLVRDPDVSILQDIATENAKRDRVSIDVDGRKSPIPYYERGQRWMERKEVQSLRAAMNYMDLNEEKRVHAAAQDEAVDLVWKHKYPDRPYENPEAFKESLKEHLREGSHARSQSIGPFSTLYVTKNGAIDGRRSASDGSTSNKSSGSGKAGGNRVVSNSSDDSKGSASSSGSRRYGSLKSSAGRIIGSMRSGRSSRRRSSGAQSGLFPNPKDRIYEEPESITENEAEQEVGKANGPLKPKSRNPSGSLRAASTRKGAASKIPWLSENKVSAIEIHKNPPSQSRDPKYTRNSTLAFDQRVQDVEEPVQTKNGIEIRSDDIRAATSRKLKDRSGKLPTPTYVSDRPGRPIVSFESGYAPKDSKATTGRPGSRDAPLAGARPMAGKPMPVATASAPAIPQISFNEDRSRQGPQQPYGMGQSEKPKSSAVPTIEVVGVPEFSVDTAADIPEIGVFGIDGGSVPTISIGPESSTTSSRPSAPPHTKTAPASNPVMRSHWSPAIPRIGAAACCTCGLHIQGRTLSAAEQRFHPECFNCFQCGINLEHVAFYPEPENAREDRFNQEEADVITRELDRRFFCHLDFHELFSPRCKSCKTPIEGELIMACGSQWHKGHFFCAQCGDPFDGGMPFIEKDGWAWCIGCYKGRYSGKCRGCKKPVIEDGVTALGAEWHESCFRCKECDGPFEDGKFFTRGAGEVPVCVRCEQRRLKA